MPIGKFLRHPQNVQEDSSNESSEEEDMEDSGEEGIRNVLSVRKTQQRNTNARLSDDDDDDDDDDDEEEEEEEEEGDDDDEDDDDEEEEEEQVQKVVGKRKRTVSSRANSSNKRRDAKVSRKFFDEYAEASSDGSDEDDDEDEMEEGESRREREKHDVVKKHYTAEDIRRENMDEEAEEIIRQQNLRRSKMHVFRADLDAAEVARQIEQRHKMESRRVDFRAAHDDASLGMADVAMSAVGQQSLLPSVSDPSMWMFGCATGKEEELVYQIMNKCIAYAKQGKPLGITAAVAAQTKGRIFIESFSEPAVMDAVQGIRNLLTYSKRLVPITDMTTVMNVVRKKKPVKDNEWVRMTRGHYKGDLALVREVRDSGLKCIIQCVPRIDLTLADLPPEEARIRRRAVRPSQKFFNAQEIAAMGRHSVTRQRFPGMGSGFMCDFFEGNHYHDGYLIKEVTVGKMVIPCGSDNPPTLDELQRFRNRTKIGDDNGDDDENQGSKVAKSLLDELSELQGKTGLGAESSTGNENGLLIGDTAEVIYGDLVGMIGKILSIDGSTVKLKPTNAADLGDMTEIAFLINQVKKHISVGAHVKVIDGRYIHETGVVVALELLEGDTDSTAVVLTDMSHKEISVRVSQLQESAEVASGQDNLAGYELHDLVVLSGGGSTNEVGVIVRVGHEEFTVINNHGIIREVRPEELRGKRNSRSMKGVALDVQGNQIRVGSTVSVAEGPHKGKTATIKWIHRAQLFLYSQTRTENAGIFVVRSRSCVLTGSKLQNRKTAGDGSNTPYMTPASYTSGPPAAFKGKREDGLINKTVKILAGQWKGYLGVITDSTATHFQVELHSRMRKVTVARDKAKVVGDKFGAVNDDPTFMGSEYGGSMAPLTPFHSGSTPHYAGVTPLHAGATPMHDGLGGYTPSHTSNEDVWRPTSSYDHRASNTSEAASTGYSSGWDNSSWKAMPNNSSLSESENNGSWGAWTSSSSNNRGSNDSSTNLISAQTSSKNDTASSYNSYSVEPTGRYTVAGISSAAIGSTDDETTPVWFMERVCVQLKKNSFTAFIKEISGNTAVVELEDRTTLTVGASELTMVEPKEHDSVLVIGGVDVGFEGELACIDGSDAILKDANEDFKIVDYVHLAKIIAD